MTKYCSNCGKENNVNSKFCRGCGKKLSGLHTINKVDKYENNKNNIDSNDKKNQIILIGIVAVLLIAIAVVGTYAFMSLNDNNESNNNLGSSNNTDFSLDTEKSTVTSYSIHLSEVYGLAVALDNKAQSQSLSTISSVEYKGVIFTKEQCLYIFSKAIDMKSRGISDDIEFGTYSSPNDPLHSYSTNYLTKSEYVDMAQRTYAWMDAHGRAPNYTGVYVAGSPDFGFDYLLTAFGLVIIDSNQGSLVSMVTW